MADMNIERGPHMGVPTGARAIRLNQKLEDPLTGEEKAKWAAVLGPPPAAPFPPKDAARVMVVEDDPDVRRLLVQILKPWEVEVVEEGNGTNALKRLASERIDLVLTDLRLPGHDGFELIRCARSYLRLQIHIVVVSGLVDPKDEIAALNLGADFYLAKPFNYERMQARLKPIVRRLYDRIGG